MTDISAHLEAKSDQLNNIDLMGGDITVTITEVKVLKKGSEQPIWVYYKGDEGKPWKPSKSMNRLMAAIWGADSSKWVGRRLTLYRDPTVTFGKDKTGGIRISHMSHLEESTEITLPKSKGKFGAITVRPLSAMAAEIDPVKALADAQAAAAKGTAALLKWWETAGPAKQNALASQKDALKAEAAKADTAAPAQQVSTETASPAQSAGPDEEVPL